MKSLSYLNKYLAEHKYYFLLGVICTVLANIFAIIPPRLVRHVFYLVQKCVIDYQKASGIAAQSLIYEKLVDNLVTYIGLTLLVAVCRGLLSWGARLSIMIMGKRAEYALRNTMYAHYQACSTKFYQKTNTGELMARISEDVNQVGMYLGPAMAYGINMLVVLLILVPYMCLINARLMLYTGLPMLMLIVGNYYIGALLRKRSSLIQYRLAALTETAQDTFSGVHVLQAFNSLPYTIDQFTRQCQAYKMAFLRRTAINALFSPIAQSIVSLGIIIVVFIGGIGVIRGEDTPGNIAELIMYLYLLAGPLYATSWINNIIQRAAASQERINDFLQKTHVLVEGKVDNIPIRGNITFRKVNLTYPKTKIEALRDASFDIKAGKTTAIIGATGSGKSTIVDLLSRLQEADTGEIKVDGLPIQDYTIAHLRTQIGYVLQDAHLFSDSCRDNIAWGKPDATDEEVAQAAKLAGIYEVIQRMPQQMHTLLSEGGKTLSGGQKQRIALARALIRTPNVLILDNCLSALDTQTASHVMQNIKSFMHKKTLILLDSRARVGRDADYILLMDAGKVVSSGTHEALLAQKGYYYKLQNPQRN